MLPILVDAASVIIAGHARWMAAKSLGFREGPVIRIEHLTETQIRALALADNKLAELSTWDPQMLGRELKELSVLDLDITIEATGFTVPEIDIRIQGLRSPADGQHDEDDFIDVTSSEAVSRTGDLWHLGDHRVLCGDALDPMVWQRLMGTDRATMMFTDPPYNLAVKAISGRGKRKHREFGQASGEMSKAAFTQFLTSALLLAARFSCDGAIHFMCMDWRHMEELLAAINTAYTQLLNVAIWTKPAGGMGSLYRSAHEMIFVAKNGNAPHCNNVQLGKFGRNRTNVWAYDRPVKFGKNADGDRFASEHPTPKPVGLVADAIMDACDRGDIVVDAFLGSGSTVLAAERVGRRCRGIELDPRYVDLVLRRFEHVTGLKVSHANGKTFSEIARQRGVSLEGMLVGEVSGRRKR